MTSTIALSGVSTASGIAERMIIPFVTVCTARMARRSKKRDPVSSCMSTECCTNWSWVLIMFSLRLSIINSCRPWLQISAALSSGLPPTFPSSPRCGSGLICSSSESRYSTWNRSASCRSSCRGTTGGVSPLMIPVTSDVRAWSHSFTWRIGAADPSKTCLLTGAFVLSHVLPCFLVMIWSISLTSRRKCSRSDVALSSRP